MDIQSTNTPITAGATLAVDARIENTGDESDSQTVALEVGGLGTDSSQVSLSGGQSTTETLSISTGSGDAGSYTADVSTNDDSDSTGVSGGDFQPITFSNVDTGALAPGEYTHQIVIKNDTISGNLTVQDQANFTASNLQLSAGTVDQGDRINVSADVTNVGDVQGTQTVSLAVDGVSASKPRTLAAGASETVTFTDVLIDLGPGTYTPTVSTANDSTSGATLTVLNQATVELQPVESEVRTFKNATIQVVVTDASNGISAYDFDIALNNTNASLLDYEMAADGSGVIDNSAISANNSSITLDVKNASLAGSPETVIANLTFQFGEVGTVQADLPASTSLNDTGDTPYATSVDGTSVSTFGPPPIIDNGQPPQDRLPLDTDGDELYEEVRGDGEFNILDVQALFNNLDNPNLQNNTDAFKFQENGASEEVTILDVQALFNELQE